MKHRVILNIKVLFAFACAAFFTKEVRANWTAPIVTINQGKLIGTTGVDLDGKEYYKFLGIPYAQPPVGVLRFKAPQPPSSWEGIRDGTSEENGCLAANRLVAGTLTGSEDCLYLNVFTKELPQPGSVPKAVMVFIPGGAFTLGSGSQQNYGARYFMTQDIVLVTLNYRLGILGFLSSDDKSLDIPGNAGLKDQTFALKWVQNNIASFNGDPNNVTLFGISAGGASVQFQLLSPTAKGLFHQAIAQSGSVLNPWVWGSKNTINQVAEILGTKVVAEREAANVLLSVSGEELVTASFNLTDQVMNANRRRPFGPVIEYSNPTEFLTKNPVQLLKSGNYNKVPLIQGAVSNEGFFYRYYFSGDSFNITSSNVVPWILNLKRDSKKYKEVEERINQFYFKDGFTLDAIYKFLSDVDFVLGVIASTKLNIKTLDQPLYLYVFSQEVPFSNAMRTIYGVQNNTIRGVGHGGDQMILFDTILTTLLGLQMTEEDEQAIRQFVKLWADFAKTGKPHQLWEPAMDPNNLKYFDIDTVVEMKTNPFDERIAFWESIFNDIPNNWKNSYEQYFN